MANKLTQFKEGNPGKPKGAANKVTKLVKDVVSQVFNDLQEDKDAAYNLKNWAKEHPKEFYQIASKLIPLQMDVSGALKIEQITGMVIR